MDALQIPYYVVFDADGDAKDQEQCGECGRGRDQRRDGVASENQKILAALGEAAEAFPSTGARDGFACFEVNLEDFLIAEIDGFRDLLQAVAGEMQWKAKSPEVYTEVIERIGSDDLPELLGAVIERVMERAQRQVAT